MAAATGATRAGQAWAKKFVVRFTDAGLWDTGPWDWKFSLAPPALRRLEAAQIDLKQLAEYPDTLTEFLRVRSNCINVAAIILVDQAKERGLDYHGFLDRMIEVMIAPGGPRRLLFNLIAVIVINFPASRFARAYRRVPEMLETEGQ